jgi:hypothetical protein
MAGTNAKGGLMATFHVSMESGVRVIRRPGSSRVKWRDDCESCLRYASDGRGPYWAFPDHEGGHRE